jgi:hypothetical protein
MGLALRNAAVSVERVTLDEFNAIPARPLAELSAHSWRPVDLLAYAEAPPAPPTIGGLAYPGRRHVFSGEPETLKSWAALVLCVEQVRAGEVALYIDLEMGASMTLERLRQLGLSEDEIRTGFVYLSPSEPMTGEDVLADVTRLVTFAKPSLIVLDAFTGALELHGYDPVSGVAIEGFYRTVVGPLQAHGAAVVMLDHVAKNKETRGRFAIDSQRKIGGVDVHLGFKLIHPFARGADGLAGITTHKDRPGHLPRPRAAELELTSDPETFAVSWRIRPAEAHAADESGDNFRPTGLMERVSRALEICRRAEVADAARGRSQRQDRLRPAGDRQTRRRRLRRRDPRRPRRTSREARTAIQETDE